MKSSQYQKIAEHPLRQVFRNMVTDSRDLPTRSELRASIEAAAPGLDAPAREALFDSAVALAKRADGNREEWFDLRGECDRRVLAVVEGWEAADQLLQAEDTEPVDVGATLEAMDGHDPTQRGLRAINAAARAGEGD